MPQETTNKAQPRPRHRLASNISLDSGPGMSSYDLRQLAQKEPQAFTRKMLGLIEERGEDGRRKLSWESIRDLGHMYRALAGVPVEVTMDDGLGVQRAIMADAFPMLAGNLTVAAVNDAYDAVPTIGQELVTERQDNKRFTQIAGITSNGGNKQRVGEGEDYPEIGAGEEKYTIASNKNGRRISITKEMIQENDLANIVERVNALGEISAEEIEEQTLKRVTDFDGGNSREPYVLHLGGSGTVLYIVTDGSPGARASLGTQVQNNALEDYTDLDNAQTLLAGMKNSRGKRISIPMSRCTLLVPNALAGKADRITGSEMVPGSLNEINSWGPKGRYRPRVLSSPKLDDLSTSAWYLGWFQKQFVRKWKMTFEYVTLGTQTESYLRSDIAFQARMSWDCEVGARDYVYVVQSIEASTNPA